MRRQVLFVVTVVLAFALVLNCYQIYYLLEVVPSENAFKDDKTIDYVLNNTPLSQLEKLEDSYKRRQNFYNKMNVVTKDVAREESPVKTSISKTNKDGINTNIKPEILEYLVEVSKENGYRLEYLEGKIHQESGWKEKFISRTQDYGLCGINQCNIENLKIVFKDKYPDFDIFYYKTNIDSMIYILNDYKSQLVKHLKRNPTEAELETAYNRGIGGFKTYVASRGDAFSRHYLAVKHWADAYKRWNDQH